MVCVGPVMTLEITTVAAAIVFGHDHRATGPARASTATRPRALLVARLAFVIVGFAIRVVQPLRVRYGRTTSGVGAFRWATALMVFGIRSPGDPSLFEAVRGPIPQRNSHTALDECDLTVRWQELVS